MSVDQRPPTDARLELLDCTQAHPHDTSRIILKETQEEAQNTLPHSYCVLPEDLQDYLDICP